MKKKFLLLVIVVIVLFFLSGCSIFDKFDNRSASYPTITPFAEGQYPLLVVTVDSIAEGHGSSFPYHSFYHEGPSGNPNHEIWYLLSRKITGLTYENFAKGSTTFEWVQATALPDILKRNPRIILIHTGVNDINLGRSWTDIENSLNLISSALTTEILVIDEILPWTAGTDEQADIIREWNENLAIWASTHNAVLIKCHDTIGQVRSSTGEIDDLKSSFADGSGVHLSNSGVEEMADIIAKEFSTNPILLKALK